MEQPHLKPCRGWTVMELLVVIVILIVIVALLSFASGAVRKKSGYVKCVHNLRQIGAGLQFYVQDHGVFPYYISGNTRWVDGKDDPHSFFAGPYLNVRPRSHRFAPADSPYTAQGGLFDCPSVNTEDKAGLGPDDWIADYFDYGLNISLCGWSVAKFPNPATTVAVVEGGHYSRVKAQGLSGKTYTPEAASNPGGTAWNWGRTAGRQSPLIFPKQRHANFLFLDGHVGLHREEELMEPWFRGY